jgi:hypothetical protein
MQNAKVMRSWRLPPRFQAMCGCKAASKKAVHEAVRVKPKLQWRPQDAAVARNVDHLLRKATGNRAAIPKRGLVACS